MAQPRFLLGVQSAAGRRERASRVGWASASQPCFVWRLVGSNNREIGRSAQAFTDAAACRTGISFLRRQLAHLDTRISCDENTRWSWRLELNGQPVAHSARVYMRRREAVFNLEQFLAAAPTADAPGTLNAPPPPPNLPVEPALTGEVAG